MREQITMKQKVFSIAPYGHPAVDDDLGSGDEARLVRGEKQRRVRGVAPIAREAQRNALQAGSQERFHVAARALLRQPRLDHRRMQLPGDRKSTRLNSSHRCISYAVFCLKKKKHIAVVIGLDQQSTTIR